MKLVVVRAEVSHVSRDLHLMNLSQMALDSSVQPKVMQICKIHGDGTTVDYAPGHKD